MPSTRSSPRALVFAFFLIVLLATALRFWALGFGLPHLMTRPDEEVILAETRSPASGKFDLEYGIYPSAYVMLTWLWGEAGLNLLQLAGAAPPGEYLQVMDWAPARILLVDRALSALAGIAAVALAMYFARRELGWCVALIAGAFLAVSFLHVRDSHAAKPDVLMSLGVVAALGVMAPLARETSLWRGVAAGALVGLSMGMKYPAVLLLVPAWVAAVVGERGRGLRRVVPPAWLAAAVAAALTFVITSPDLLLNPRTRNRVLSIVVLVFPQLFPHVEDTGGVPRGMVDIAHVGSVWEGYAYYYDFALRYGVGLVAVVLAPIAIVWGALSRRPLALVSAVFAAVAFVVFGASPALLSRYMTPAVPALAILLGGLIVAVARQLVAARWLGWSLALATLVLIAEPLDRSVAHDRIASNTDTRVLASRWLEAHAEPGTRVAVAGTVFWSWGEPWIPPAFPMVRTDLDAGKIASEKVRYLVTHDHPLFSSRIDPAALEALAPRLRLRADFDPFVGPRDQAQFDAQDAYYIPMAGMDAVVRPGPHVRIYEFD